MQSAVTPETSTEVSLQIQCERLRVWRAVLQRPLLPRSWSGQRHVRQVPAEHRDRVLLEDSECCSVLCDTHESACVNVCRASTSQCSNNAQCCSGNRALGFCF